MRRDRRRDRNGLDRRVCENFLEVGRQPYAWVPSSNRLESLAPGVTRSDDFTFVDFVQVPNEVRPSVAESDNAHADGLEVQWPQAGDRIFDYGCHD